MSDLTVKLAACPCGKVPTAIVVMDSGQGEKWASAVPNCCGMWMIEFRTKYLDQETAEFIRLAEDAWNNAPRAER